MKNLSIIVIIALLLNACAWKTGSNSETQADSLDVSTESVNALSADDLRYIIDSIKSKQVITREDFDFVCAHANSESDHLWCDFQRIEMRYDSLEVLRETIGKHHGNQSLKEILDTDWKLFREYEDAAREAYCICEDIHEIGSASGRGYCILGVTTFCEKLYETATCGTMSVSMGMPAAMEIHKSVTKTMTDRSYALLRNEQQDSWDYTNSTSHNLGHSKTHKQKLLKIEQAKWDKWMDYRKSVAPRLPENVRPYFENGTNNAMRAKLIQLKNQNANIGIYSGDVIKCELPEACTDEELQEYKSFSYIMGIYSNHLDDDEWTDWKRYRIYVDK